MQGPAGSSLVRAPFLTGAVPVRSETVLPSSCELRGPQGLNHGGTALLGGGTLVGGDLLLSGQLELLSIRLDLDGRLGVNETLQVPPGHLQRDVLCVAACAQTRSLTLEDAEVLMSHNETGEVERGGACAANGSVTLRRSSLMAACRKH